MKSLRYTLLSDGSSDAALIPILQWLLKENGVSIPIAAKKPDFGRYPKPPKTLPEKIAYALKEGPCDLLFIHRDAEKQNWQLRADEIQHAVEQTQEEYPQPTLPVIPVRMTEAWLLFNEQAIRTAAGNPNGTETLELPALAKLEELPDPKSDLRDLLKTASGLHGRRLSNFRWEASIQKIPNHITDFSDLRRLSAFLQLEKSLYEVISEQLMEHP